MPKISIVILSYNTRDITDKCLLCVDIAQKKLKLQLNFDVETIVVDNLSTDSSSEMIQKKYPWVKIINPHKNTGFTGGNNLGMKSSTGEYLLLLNSDAFLEEDTLVKCITFMQGNKDCDVFGCKLKFADGKFQPSAGYLPNPINTFLWVWGVDVLPGFKQIIPSVHPQRLDFFTARRVGWITGAFMFMKREVYEKSGGMDENFFMYMEEVEWCKRMNNLGYSVWYVPDFEIVHLLGASSNYDNSVPLTKEMSGLVYYFKKHYPLLMQPMKFIIWLGNIARVVAFTIVGNPKRANIYKQIVKSL